MSRIVIDAREYSQSTGRYVNRLLDYLQHQDKTNDYAVLLKPSDMDKAQFSNPRFKKVACPYKEFTFAEQLPLAWQLYRLKPDLVHFAITQQPLLYLGKSITTFHDLTTARFKNPAKNSVVFWIKQQVYKVVIWYAAHKSRQLFANSEFTKQDVVAYTKVNPDKITVTYEAADLLPAGGQPVAHLEGEQFIMYIGRPTPHKNLDRLIAAHQQLLAQHPKLKLVLVGKTDSNYQAHQARVKNEGLKNIVFTGFVPDDQLRWLFEHCTAYIFPSLSEGFGLPALEAMRHGAPVASSNATCLPEIYGDAAHYFDPTDVQAMADAINEVITNKELRQRLIEAGPLQAAKYSWQRCAEQTLAVYEQVLKA